ncbi:MAG: Flp family type IVb pilin [Dehalococcoidales bacterium]|nr:Flp family type IVb pilin [Dehalococcoidales bacterium]
MGRVANDEKGQGLVEYALLLVLVAVALLVAVLALGNGLSSTYSDIVSNIASL